MIPPPKCSEGIRGSKPAKNPAGREFPVTTKGAFPFAGAAHLLRAVAIMSWGQAAKTAPCKEPIPPLRPAAQGRGCLLFPVLPRLTGGSDTSQADGQATRLANAMRARSPPANVNRAVGRSECCQALIKASCADGLAAWPSSHSPCPSHRGGPKRARLSAGRGRKLAQLCTSYQQVLGHGRNCLGYAGSCLAVAGEKFLPAFAPERVPEEKRCLGFRDFWGGLNTNVAR